MCLTGMHLSPHNTCLAYLRPRAHQTMAEYRKLDRPRRYQMLNRTQHLLLANRVALDRPRAR